jgi:hypothetical protein
LNTKWTSDVLGTLIQHLVVNIDIVFVRMSTKWELVGLLFCLFVSVQDKFKQFGYSEYDVSHKWKWKKESPRQLEANYLVVVQIKQWNMEYGYGTSDFICPTEVRSRMLFLNGTRVVCFSSFIPHHLSSAKIYFDFYHFDS